MTFTIRQIKSHKLDGQLAVRAQWDDGQEADVLMRFRPDQNDIEAKIIARVRAHRIANLPMILISKADLDDENLVSSDPNVARIIGDSFE